MKKEVGFSSSLDMVAFDAMEVERFGFIEVKRFGKKYFINFTTKVVDFNEEEIETGFVEISDKLKEKECTGCGKEILKEEGFMVLPVFETISSVYTLEKNKETGKMFFFKFYAEQEEVFKQEVEENKKFKKRIIARVKTILQKEISDDDFFLF